MAHVIQDAKVEASSLVEVTVAMVILVIILSLSMTILLRMATTGHTGMVVKYNLLAKEHALNVKRDRLFIDGSIRLGETELSRKVSAYGKDLLLLEIAVLNDSGDTLYQYKEILYEPD